MKYRYRFIPIKDMSLNRKDVIDKFNFKNKTLVLHFLKCELMPNDNSFNHWVREITRELVHLNENTIKPKNKLPDRDLIFTELFTYVCDSVSDVRFYIDTICDEYNVSNEILDDYKLCTDIANKYFNFARQCSEVMSKQENDSSVFEQILKSCL